METRLKVGLALWFTVVGITAKPLCGHCYTLPEPTDNDSVQTQKGRNTLPRVINLKEVNVLAPRQLTQPTMAQALNEQRLVAGSTSLVQMSPLRQRLSTLKDALAMQPGVIIQEFFGLNDQPPTPRRVPAARRHTRELRRRLLYNRSDGPYDCTLC